MTALAAARNLQIKEQGVYVDSFAMVDNVKIYKGGMVCVVTSSGLARPAADTASFKIVGIAEYTVDNTQTGHAAGAWPPTNPEMGVGNWVRCRSGIVVPMNASSAAQSWVGTLVTVVDDQTVAQAATTTNDITAGMCVAYESATRVWVYIAPPGVTVA